MRTRRAFTGNSRESLHQQWMISPNGGDLLDWITLGTLESESTLWERHTLNLLREGVPHLFEKCGREDLRTLRVLDQKEPARSGLLHSYSSTNARDVVADGP